MKDIVTWKAYLECECGRKEHLVCLEYDSELGPSISFQLSHHLGFFRRLVAAAKYAMGRNDCGSWDCCLIRKDDIPTLRRWMQNVDDHGPGIMG